MAKRPNPTVSGTSVNMPAPVDGVDNLPLPSGVNVAAKEQANEMPEVNMSTNDGDNPKAVQAPFANGTDQRSKRPTPTSSPTPAMPGAAG
jgi:hypothetical protein